MRLAAGLTLEELAAQAGFGKAYLSRIENGKKVPPIATLSRLADVLGTEAASLLAARGRAVSWRGVNVVRHEEKRPTVLGRQRLRIRLFRAQRCHRSSLHSAILVLLSGRDRQARFLPARGRRASARVAGTIEWQIGAGKFLLQPGDTIHFDSRIPHRGHSVAGPATALVVMHSTAGSGEHLG
jgi:transcriptional regulator with XRE-family HTH domain